MGKEKEKKSVCECSERAHSDQSVPGGERTLPGCRAALDDGGDINSALQADPAVWKAESSRSIKVKPSQRVCRGDEKTRDTLVSHQVDVDGSDESPTQGLAPAHHHVDEPAAAQHRLHHLLPVLVGQVHVVDLQQPVVHPG